MFLYLPFGQVKKPLLFAHSVPLAVDVDIFADFCWHGKRTYLSGLLFGDIKAVTATVHDDVAVMQIQNIADSDSKIGF